MSLLVKQVEVEAEFAIFIAELAESLYPTARKNFDEIAQLLLVRSLRACGMTTYPPVTGYSSGERASGDIVCRSCGRDYFSHPLDWRVIGYGNRPFLHVLCDGNRVKL